MRKVRSDGASLRKPFAPILNPCRVGASVFESRNRRMAADASLAGIEANVSRNTASAFFRFAASGALAKSAAAARNLASGPLVDSAAAPRVSVPAATLCAGTLDDTTMAPTFPTGCGHHHKASVTAISKPAPPANHLKPSTRIFHYGHRIPHCRAPAKSKDAEIRRNRKDAARTAGEPSDS